MRSREFVVVVGTKVELLEKEAAAFPGKRYSTMMSGTILTRNCGITSCHEEHDETPIMRPAPRQHFESVLLLELIFRFEKECS